MTKFIEGRLRAGSSNLLGEVLTLVERRLFLQVSRHSRSNLSQVGRILRITRSTARNWNRSASRAGG
jgi:DNA-binding protein Fis